MINDTAASYPVASLSAIPAGDYYVQAVLSLYTQFHRADGHVIWAHMDQWEGQHFGTSPGIWSARCSACTSTPPPATTSRSSLTRVLPPIALPPDSKWVKHVKIQSDLLTKFWGHPMYLGATVLLPAGYDSHPNVAVSGHLRSRGTSASRAAPRFRYPHGQPIPEPYARDPRRVQPAARLRRYSRSWSGPSFPRMIAVNFQHPTPYFDDSYAVNSANNGPYGDAIMTELIPYLESHFRIIAKPYARVLTGGSTGGWESLALQALSPRLLRRDVDALPGSDRFPPLRTGQRLHRHQRIRCESRQAARVRPDREIGFRAERYFMRGNNGQPFITMRDFSRFEDVLGSHGRSAEQLEIWEAVYGPVGSRWLSGTALGQAHGTHQSRRGRTTCAITATT